MLNELEVSAGHLKASQTRQLKAMTFPPLNP